MTEQPGRMTHAALLIVTFLFIMSVVTGCGTGEPEVTAKPSVLLILVDTFRSDHMSCSGYYRSTTPVMDSLAASGTAWLSLQSQSSWTLPAMTTIMTGLSQRTHGAGWRDGTFYGIDPALPTMARTLGAQGYQTAAFFNVIFMNEDFGFHRGFEHFDCMGFVGDASTRNAEDTVEDLITWFDSSRDPSRPLFAAIHFFDPHLPYAPPEPWNSMFTDPLYEGPFNSEWGGRDDVVRLNSGETSIDSAGLANLVGLYDGELAFTDNAIGSLIRSLETRGALEGTIVLVVGDHGEEFLEHGGIGHGHTMYQELLEVPLIICGDRIRSGGFDPVQAAQIDILPTLLSLIGSDDLPHVEGMDLFSMSVPDSIPRALPSSNRLWAATDLAAVLAGDDKIIGNPSLDISVGFDLSVDPGEFSPVEPNPELVEALDIYWSQPPEGSPDPVPFAETVERTLRDLGYIR